MYFIFSLINLRDLLKSGNVAIPSSPARKFFFTCAREGRLSFGSFTDERSCIWTAVVIPRSIMKIDVHLSTEFIRVIVVGLALHPVGVQWS